MDPPPDSTGTSELRRLAERYFGVSICNREVVECPVRVGVLLLRTEDLGFENQQTQIYLRFQQLWRMFETQSLDISHEKIKFLLLEIQKETLNRSYSCVALIFAVKIQKRLTETESTTHQTKSV